jgi:alkylhydroperoxidase family enzyme
MENVMRIELPENHQAQPLAHLAESYAPEIVRAGMNFSKTTYDKSRISLREFEGARMRTALINGCELCQNFRAARDLPAVAGDARSVTVNGARPDEAFYQAVADYRGSPLLSDREKLAVEYADGMGRNPQGIAVDESFWSRFKAAYSDDEIVDLTYCIACWMGLGRMAHVLGLDSVCAIPALQNQAAA